MRQSAVLFLLTIGVVLGVVVWGIPALVEVAGFLGELRSSSEPINEDGGVGPFSPQLAQPFEATSSARIKIQGFSSSGVEVVLYNNGRELAQETVNSEGEFEFLAVNLVRGENELAVRAVDRGGRQSPFSRSWMVVFDPDPPVLTVEEPKDGDEFFGIEGRSIEVKGKSESGVDVFVNDRLTRAGEQGQFSDMLFLESGENRIMIRAVDAAGNESREELSVRYSE